MTVTTMQGTDPEAGIFWATVFAVAILLLLVGFLAGWQIGEVI